MAKLTYSQRKSLPDSAFAIVRKVKNKKTGKIKKDREFPVQDKPHARNALQRLPQAKGLTGSEKKKVTAKADKELGISSKDRRLKDLKKRQKTM